MSEPTVAEATDSIYASLQANNADIDAHIATLKAALTREGIRQAVLDPTRLAQNNRFGPQADAGLFSAARREREVFGLVSVSVELLTGGEPPPAGCKAMSSTIALSAGIDALRHCYHERLSKPT